jgi:hypothetical protein
LSHITNSILFSFLLTSSNSSCECIPFPLSIYSGWTFGLFSLFGCYGHKCTSLHMCICFHSSICLGEELLGHG